MSLLPGYIFKIADILEEHHYHAYLVGGSLRDILLGYEPKDYDIATKATPDQIMELFPQSIPTGAKYGTVVVLVEDENGATQEVEVTTYRSESDYVGGRWPSKVEFTKNILEDLERRDFTINAMALKLDDELKKHINDLTPEWLLDSKELMDPFHGKKDLENKLIRAVGNPIERFKEDGLRAMRACRLASVLNFDIEKKTYEAIKESLDIAAQISMERVHDEFLKMLKNSPKPSVGIELMRKTGLLELYIPELLEGYGMDQNKYHVEDVYYHSLRAVDIAPKEVRIAALFHDIGKARTKDGEHFYGHDEVGADMTREILRRLKFSRKSIENISNLVRWHMFYIPEHPDKEEERIKDHPKKQKKRRKKAFKKGWTDAAIRRLIHRVGGHESIDNLIKLRIADSLANPKRSFDPEEIQQLAVRVAEIRQQDSVMSISDLKLKGNEIIELGVPKGPTVKKVQEYLLHQVIDHIELNNKDDLKKLVRKYLKKHHQINRNPLKRIYHRIVRRKS
jgi:tRNA nucleotidyltransferase (CCA-adding enzyme)